MNILTKLKIGPRLGLGFAAVIALMLATVAFTALSLTRIIALQRSVDEAVAREQIVRAWESETRLNLARTLAIAKSGYQSELVAYLQPAMRQASARITELQEQLSRAGGQRSDEGLLAAVAEQRSHYLATRDRLFAQLQGDNRAGAMADVDARLLPAADAYMNAVGALAQQVSDRAGQGSRALQAKAEDTRSLLAGLALLVLGVGALMAWGITRSLTRPIDGAVRVAQRVASGDLTTDITVDRGDELGELQQALAHMRAQLRHIIGRVQASSDSIATGAGQIAEGNADLSQRTEEQASNLQQTAASMEQLTATVKQNADTARQATQLAGSASAAATDGGRVVGQVVATMEDITQASRKIADIIGVIDGIAFQTNILALNAAVEAARAGEQGRGFAVVASEVRSLAQRSAEAAKEIKNLIGASVEKVENGSRLVDEAGRSINDIVSQVRRVTDLVAEISAASIEQSSGISQIGDAVSQLDQVTQQNAALVEESAAAAESLKHQAAQMAQVVSVFRVGAAEPRFNPVAPKPEAADSTRSATTKSTTSLPTPAGLPAAPKQQARAAELAAAGNEKDWTSF